MKDTKSLFVSHWGSRYGCPLLLYDVRPTADAVCTIEKSPTRKSNMVLHIPLAESRKVGSERRAVGAVDAADRTSFPNPKTLIPCSLAFWVPDLGFGCGIMAKNRLSHTRLSWLKVPLSCKIG